LRYRALWNLGVICSREGRQAEAVELDRRAVSLCDSVLKQQPRERQLRFDLLKLLGNLSTGVPRAEQFELWDRRLVVIDGLVADFPEDVEFQNMYLDIAETLMLENWQEGKRDESRKISDEAFGVFQSFQTQANSTPFLVSRTSLLLEDDNYVTASETLAKVPINPATFQPAQSDDSKAVHAALGDDRARRKTLDDLQDTLRNLERIAEFHRECARLAESDTSLTDQARSNRRQTSSSLAAQFKLAAERCRGFKKARELIGLETKSSSETPRAVGAATAGASTPE
jgi:hypothetical protein